MNGPLKWHGGKGMMAGKIAALMPPHTHYVEPFAGGLSVLFAKNPEGVSEVVNDLNSGLSNFWAVLADGDLFERFRRFAEATPFSEAVWENAMAALEEHGAGMDPVSRAWAFFVACRQSLAGRMASFTGVTKTRTRAGMNGEVSAWLSAVEGLPAVHERLKRVLILNRDALDVVRGQDGEKTLFYLDPPYLHETRTSPDVYAHEMTFEQHRDLLVLLSEVKGRFLLSGYRSRLYDDAARDCGWHRTDFDIANHSAGGKAKRRMTECVYCNFDPAAT